MCYVIYGTAILLFFLYSDAVIAPLVLALGGAEGEMMGIAIGWEMLTVLWPVMLLFAILASFITYLLTRRFLRAS